MTRYVRKAGTSESTETLRDVYQRVTDSIITQLEAGVRPWHQPWKDGVGGNRGELPRRHDGTPYRGINTVLLWGEQLTKGYATTIWMTYRQATALGGQVRKGEKGSLVVYANKAVKPETDDKGEEKVRAIPFMKGYTVFNVAQIDGLPAHYYHTGDDAPALPEAEHLEAVDTFVANTKAIVRHGGDKAFYSPTSDYVAMPHIQAFETKEHYASTLLHEMVHWTGHAARCDRQFGKRFGSEAYAAEELVAEIGAAFLCASLDIAPTERLDHAAYVDNWLKVLKGDKRAIFTAATAAQRAADHLHGLQGEVATEETEEFAEAA